MAAIGGFPGRDNPHELNVYAGGHFTSPEDNIPDVVRRAAQQHRCPGCGGRTGSTGEQHEER